MSLLELQIEYNGSRVNIATVIHKIKGGDTLKGIPDIQMCQGIINHINLVYNRPLGFTAFGDPLVVCILDV